MDVKLSISPGFLMLAAFFAFGGYRFFNFRMLIMWLFAAAVHEAAHLLAALLLRVSVRGINFDVLGIRIELERGMISYQKEIAIAAAGPAANLLSFAAFGMRGDFATFSLMLGIINLLPIKSLDGYRILHSLAALFCGMETAERAMRILSGTGIIFLWSMGVYMLLRYRANLPLFLLSCSLFVSQFL
ncbi:MAG: site-2 protease family protein [Eubacteriales bacterium]